MQLFELSQQAQTVLEIGSYVGASACAFGAAFMESGIHGKVLCVDTWQNHAMIHEAERDTWEEFCRHTAPYKDAIVPIRGWSTAVVDEVKALTDRC